VYRERRNGVRFSIVKDGVVNIRLPIMLTPDQEREQFSRLNDWLSKVMHKKSNIVHRFVRNEYKSGDQVSVGTRTYYLEVSYEDRKSHSAKISKGTVFFNLASGDSPEGQQKAIRQLLSKVVANDFLPEISRRTHEINHLHFRKEIKSITFKYNHSNWGSCSRSGNINFSTRLMFAPDDVIDYVIIHELSHLLEMNHSARFWKIVESIMPDYQEKEKWLTANSSLCDF
jgi:predicted metal-dependent hydrolase